MVSVDKQNHTTVITLRPRLSMSWKNNKLIVISLLVITGIISTGFALIGAWVIMPFAGIEMAILFASLYYVNWKLSYCQVIEVDDNSVRLFKGVYYPKHRWTLPKYETSVLVRYLHHPLDSPEIIIKSKTKEFSVGEFLVKEECEKLLEAMRAVFVPVLSAK